MTHVMAVASIPKPTGKRWLVVQRGERVGVYQPRKERWRVMRPTRGLPLFIDPGTDGYAWAFTAAPKGET